MKKNEATNEEKILPLPENANVKADTELTPREKHLESQLKDYQEKLERAVEVLKNCDSVIGKLRSKSQTLIHVVRELCNLLEDEYES